MHLGGGYRVSRPGLGRIGVCEQGSLETVGRVEVYVRRYSVQSSADFQPGANYLCALRSSLPYPPPPPLPSSFSHKAKKTFPNYPALDPSSWNWMFHIMRHTMLQKIFH